MREEVTPVEDPRGNGDPDVWRAHCDWLQDRGQLERASILARILATTPPAAFADVRENAEESRGFGGWSGIEAMLEVDLREDPVDHAWTIVVQEARRHNLPIVWRGAMWWVDSHPSIGAPRAGWFTIDPVDLEGPSFFSVRVMLKSVARMRVSFELPPPSAQGHPWASS